MRARILRRCRARDHARSPSPSKAAEADAKAAKAAAVAVSSRRNDILYLYILRRIYIYTHIKALSGWCDDGGVHGR